MSTPVLLSFPCSGLVSCLVMTVFCFAVLFSLCSAGTGLQAGRAHCDLGSQKCCCQRGADLPGFCQHLKSPTVELWPESKGKALSSIYQHNSTVRFGFKPSLSALIKPQTRVDNNSLSCSICLQKYKIYKKRSLGLSPKFSPSFDPLESRKQGTATNCFIESVLFTKGIISASFLGCCQKRLSCLLQTVKDLLANNNFSRSLFCQEMWKMKVRTHGETLWCYRPWGFIHGMWHLWIPENDWFSWPSKSMSWSTDGGVDILVIFILEQVQWELLFSAVGFAISTQSRFGITWIIGNCHTDSTLVIRCWFWGALQVQCRNSQLAVGWHSPRALHVLCQKYSKCLWHPGSELCLPGNADKTKWGYRERKQIADNSLCCLTNGMSWFHLGVFCGDKGCCEWRWGPFMSGTVVIPHCSHGKGGKGWSAQIKVWSQISAPELKIEPVCFTGWLRSPGPGADMGISER